ncbi:MAG: hypothetical protein LBM99_06365 [Bacillales bacterium]|jgi:hypothetical protein|nr:hypothetical protein [Bacillales bacterium]
MVEIKVEDFNILIDKKEKYIQINDVQEVEKLFLLIKEKYKNYQIDFCYHNNIPPKIALKSIGAILLDDSLEMKLEKRNLIKQTDDGIIKVTKDNFELFAKCHDTKSLNMYWNSKRIFSTLDDWSIFMILANGEIIGYVLTAIWNLEEAEIYALVMPNAMVGITLLLKAVQDAFNRNHKKMLFMVENNTLEHLCSLEVSFKETGFYQSYRITL